MHGSCETEGSQNTTVGADFVDPSTKLIFAAIIVRYYIQYLIKNVFKMKRLL